MGILIPKCVTIKAGRFVSLADCYASKLLVDNAAFLFVNSMVAFRTQAAISSHYYYPNLISSCRGLIGRASTSPYWGHRFDSHLWQDLFHVFAQWNTHFRWFAHLGICGRGRITLSRFQLRGQLQYRTALVTFKIFAYTLIIVWSVTTEKKWVALFTQFSALLSSGIVLLLLVCHVNYLRQCYTPVILLVHTCGKNESMQK